MYTVDRPRDTGLGVAEETPKMVQQAPQVVNTTAGSILLMTTPSLLPTSTTALYDPVE